MAQDWTRIEGMIIGHELDPSAVAGELKKRAILAQIEWFPLLAAAARPQRRGCR